MRVAAGLLLLLACAGCVERRLFIRTDPPGAAVFVNGEDVGRSPVNWRFYHYGKVLVEAERQGYEAESRVVDLKAPWYQYPVADFVSDVLTPAKVEDYRYVSIEMRELVQRSEEEIAAEIRALSEKALAMRARAMEPISYPDEKNEKAGEREESGTP